jgi:hypothetical protein
MVTLQNGKAAAIRRAPRHPFVIPFIVGRRLDSVLLSVNRHKAKKFSIIAEMWLAFC